MRIRKHASKILGTASSVFCLLPSSPPPSSPAPAAGLLQSNYFCVCELNRSPWDVLPFPPLPPRRLLDPPPNPKEEEGEAIVGNEIKEEPISVIESKQSFGSAQAMRKDECDDEEHDDEKKKKKKKKRRRSTDDVKKHKRRVKKDTRVEARSPGVVITCKKTDGKKWRCKRPAHHPNSFCHYHLTQLRSYSYTANNQRVPATAGDDGDRSRRRRTVKDSGSFYYYSAFGPWRGKRRGGDSAETVAPAKAADEEDNKDEEQKEADDQENNVNEDVAVDDDADDDDDDDSEDESERDEEKRNHKSNTRKKGRKPVKARSLKSLL